MKLTGALMIGICFLLCAVIKAQKLIYRVRLLKESITFLAEIKNAVSYLSVPITQVLSLYDFEITRSCRNNLKTSGDFSLSWEEAVKNTKLQNEEKELLTEFGKNFGNFDLEGSISQITLLENRLKNILINAENEKAQKYKLYLSLGAMAAASAVILTL